MLLLMETNTHGPVREVVKHKTETLRNSEFVYTFKYESGSVSLIINKLKFSYVTL